MKKFNAVEFNTNQSKQQIIFKLLDTIEGVYRISTDVLSKEDLEDYAVAAILAHKWYGRKAATLHDVVSDLEGLGAVTLHNAGITFADYQNACNL